MNGQDLSFSDEAYRVLEEKIVTLELVPNQLHTENDLVTISGRGRTPTREAVQRLERDMLVQILPRRGVLIEPIDFSRTLMTMDVRARLEPMMMERAARYSDDDERARFNRVAQRIEDSVNNNDRFEFPRLDRKFTQLAMQCARHEVAARILLPLHAVSRRIGYLAAQQRDGGQRESAALHAKIARAIADADQQTAAATTEELIEKGRMIVMTIEDEGWDDGDGHMGPRPAIPNEGTHP